MLLFQQLEQAIFLMSDVNTTSRSLSFA